jgi:competence protein ComEA
VRWFLVVGIGAVIAAGWGTAGAGKAVDGVVNLNTAPPDVLGLLPGIGPAKAADIVAYRRRRPFRTVDELVRIKGIGRKMVRALRSHLAIAGPTTAKSAPGGAPPAPAPPTAAPAQPRPRPPPSAVACTPRPLAKRPAPVHWPTHSACPRPR